VKVYQAYRFALDPAPAQERALRSHAGAARFAWNWGLAKCKEGYEAEGKWYSAVDLHKLWNAEKRADPALVWWPENSKCAYQEAFRDLGRALQDFTASKKGDRKGRRLGFPRLKSAAGARRRSGSAPARCAAVGPRSCCRGWGRSARTSPPASSPAGLSAGPPGQRPGRRPAQGHQRPRQPV
jgi:hypothetical protein